MTQKLFSELGLSEVLLKAIDQLGYEKAAPIQAETIPLILAGHDIIGQSQTGSGKTAAFAIPAVEMIDPQTHGVQVLILCPTRELAMQVAEEIYKLSAFKRSVHSVPIYGGQSYDRQIRGLKQGAQIVIGTPGRILDHLSRGTLVLTNVRMVVLDESDEMLDMGFRDDIEEVLRSVPKNRQFICFSATMSKPILELIRKQSSNPRTVKIEHKVLTVPTVEQAYYEIRGRSKTEALTRLIDIYDLKLGIIFCNTKRIVDELTEEMVARGYSADRIHGDMSQAQREKVMGRFRSSAIEFLVATDVAARGIDVENIEVVFNYDIPWDEEDYVHRIGRTGRAGRSGRAFSLIAGREIYKLQSIERYTRMKIPRQQVPSLEEVEEKRTNVFFEKIRTALQKGEFQKEARIVDRLLEQGFSSTDIACALVHELRKEEASRADDSFDKVREKRSDSRSTERAPRYRGSRQKRR
ncbi:MAG TPA: DEAD/DEAH box helicase [Chthoniobacterales bacterium]|nr:DEAD/DEAH box helicase [Chthoniobacterales bacterium]